MINAQRPDENSRLLMEEEKTDSENNRFFAHQAAERQRQINLMRRHNNQSEIRQNFNEAQIA